MAWKLAASAVAIGTAVLMGATSVGPAASAVEPSESLGWGVKGSRLEVRNETNLSGYTPVTFEIRTTLDGGDWEAAEYHQDFLQPGESWSGAGNNEGNEHADVNARIYVNGELRAVIAAGNPSLGSPWIRSRWGLTTSQGQHYPKHTDKQSPDEPSGGEKKSDGLDFWYYRANDSAGAKQFIVSIWSLPKDRTLDRKPGSGGSGQ